VEEQHTPINDVSRERQHQFGVGNTAEVVRQVRVNDVRLPSMQPLLHLDYRLLGISPRAVSVLLWRKEEALLKLHEIMGKLKLTVNEAIWACCWN
jgi:hypothetical protein